MFHCMFKAEFVMLVSLKVPSGREGKVAMEGQYRVQREREGGGREEKKPVSSTIEGNGWEGGGRKKKEVF